MAGFDFEAEMLPVLADQRRQLLHRRPSCAFRPMYEVAMATGVPDLVLVRFDEDVLRARDAAGLGPVIDATECAVLDALRRRRRTADEVAGAVAMSTRHVGGTVLSRLADRGYVTFDNGTWSRHEALASTTTGIVAIEAKRTDWRKASSQARRYLTFANEAYVAVDEAYGHRVEPWADRLAATGIGVATAGVTGAVTVLARCGWTEPRVRWHALLAGERCWDLRRESSTSGPTWPVFGRNLTAAALPTSVGELVRTGAGRP